MAISMDSLKPVFVGAGSTRPSPGAPHYQALVAELACLGDHFRPRHHAIPEPESARREQFDG